MKSIKDAALSHIERLQSIHTLEQASKAIKAYVFTNFVAGEVSAGSKRQYSFDIYYIQMSDSLAHHMTVNYRIGETVKTQFIRENRIDGH